MVGRKPEGAARYIPLLLLLIIGATFWPLLTCNFTTWDDDNTVVRNPWLNPPALFHFAEFWNPRRPHMDIYIPLTYSAWSAVAALSYVPVPDPETGAFLNPWIFHGTNLLIHACSALLVFAILKRFTNHPWASAAGAALYALHPVQVEPVAWVSGLKDVLAGCLALLSIWQYLIYAVPVANGADAENRSDRSRRWLHYALAVMAFVAAMLAKPSAVIVPLVIGAIDLGLLRRQVKEVVAALLPWLLLAVPIIIEGRFAQPAASVLGYVTPVPLRPLIATDALAYYLYKLFLPIWHCIVYDRTPQSALRHGWPYFTWIAPLAVAAIAWLWRRRFPWLIASVGVFWLSVLPVLGLMPFDFQDHSTVADHYLYLAMLGPAIALAFALSRKQHRVVIGVATIILCLLAVRSFAQTWNWRDSFTLYRHALAVNPHGWVTRENVGRLYDDTGHPQEALAELQRATEDLPPSITDQAAHHESLGDALNHLRRYDEALAEYETVEKLVPGNPVIQRKLARLRNRNGH